jgi:acid stress-induced BolA-like protein IbaG/YrbA
MIQRHQLVYATLGALMGREIHALSMQALTPEEAGGAPGR